MKTYDWIVVGGGIAGAALGYELASAGLSVLLLEKDLLPDNATRYSYGGIAYWSATTALNRALCQESRELYPQLSTQLGAEIQFREFDLLLTIDRDADTQTIAQSYSPCLVPPTLISASDACQMEPLLNQDAIAAALHVRHGHVEPELMTTAYKQAMERLGGEVKIAQVTGFMMTGDRVEGVTTVHGTEITANVAVAAGGLSRSLLQRINCPTRCYFTHAELIETLPIDLKLSTMIMPALQQRFPMEAEAGRAEQDPLWTTPGHEIVPPILDSGIVQFLDNRLRIGQISRVLTDPDAPIDAVQSEADLRTALGHILPTFKEIPGQWHHCLVAFSGDRLPLMGALPEIPGIHLFSGFSNPFALLPPLARRFAHHIIGQSDPIICQLSPTRFSL